MREAGRFLTVRRQAILIAREHLEAGQALRLESGAKTVAMGLVPAW